MNSSLIYSGEERRINSASLQYSGRERRTHTNTFADERTLVASAAAGDRQAYALLYDRFVDRIYAYLFYRVDDAATAEELAGQVFAKAWQIIGSYQWAERRPFSAWLHRIAHDVIADYLHAHQNPISSSTPTAGDESSRGVEPIGESRLTAKALRGALSSLTQEQRQVVILRFLQGYDTEQVAQIMDKQPDAIRQLQYHALVGLSGILPKGSVK